MTTRANRGLAHPTTTYDMKYKILSFLNRNENTIQCIFLVLVALYATYTYGEVMYSLGEANAHADNILQTTDSISTTLDVIEAKLDSNQTQLVDRLSK